MITSKKAQSILEFTILLVIVMAVFLAMQSYVKRGIQGRWKASLDDFGDQYDPRLMNSNVVYKMVSNSATAIQTIKETDGYWTKRIDNSQSISTTNGTTAVGSSF